MWKNGSRFLVRGSKIVGTSQESFQNIPKNPRRAARARFCFVFPLLPQNTKKFPGALRAPVFALYLLCIRPQNPNKIFRRAARAGFCFVFSLYLA
jgi:hypothetical protein